MLTPAEAERLAMLAEEAGEIIQAIGKALRHGYESKWPNGMTNREYIRAEVTDFLGVLQLCTEENDLEKITGQQINIAVGRRLRYTHHQTMEQK